MRVRLLRLSATLTLTLAGLAALAVVIGRALPAGSHISFEAAVEANNDIYGLDLNLGTTVNLTHSRAPDFGASWSPDGTRMAFVSARAGWYQLHLLTLDGDVRRLGNELIPPTYGPVWSPDGSSIVYEVDLHGAKVLYVVHPDDPLVAGVNPHILEPTTSINRFPAWSPDGQEIAFVSWRTGDAEIFTIHPDGTGLTNLTASSGWEVSPAWSPDSTRIAYFALVGRYRELFVMNRDGSGVRQLTDIRDIENGNYWRAPAWSPDGRWLAYQAVVGGSVEILVSDATSGERRRLTHDSLLDALPLWLPDGQRLIYMAGRGTHSAVYVVNADGTSPRALTPEDGSAKYPMLWH